MPNRRRRRLSTATSAVAALAVVSPFAYSAITDMAKPAPQPREFRSAAMVTDLPNELMSALSQGLSQFGINLPAMPSALGGASTGTPTTLTAPNALTSPGLTPGLTSPAATGLTPGLTNPAATGLTPGLTTPPAATPALTDPALSSTSLLDPTAAANPALTSPVTTPGGTAGVPGLGAQPAANPALNPALTSPTGAAPGGLTTPPVTGLDPAPATTPISNAVGLPNPGEMPISAPIGLGPTGAQTFPLLGGGDTLGSALPAASTGSGSGGLLSDLSSAAQQLGAGQAIDLLKGVVMPMITSAMKPPAVAPPVPAPPPPPAG